MEEQTLVEFIEGRLSDAEAAEVRQQIETNPEVADNYRTLRLCYDALYFAEARDLKAKMSTWPSTNTPPSSRLIVFWQRNRMRLAAAAGVILLLTCLFILQQPSQREQLFANYYYSMAPDVTRSINDPTFTTAYLKMLDAYEDGNDALAITRAKTIDESNKNFTAARFLLTDIYVQHRQFENAIAVVNQMRQRPGNPPKEQDQWDWLHALILLRMEQNDRALPYLEEIKANANHTFHIKAMELSADLNL